MAEWLTGKRRLPISRVIGASFGGVWGCLGSLALVGSPRYGLLVLSVLITAGVLVRLSRFGEPGSASAAMFSKGPYLVAVALEVLAIAAAGAVLPRFGAEGYLLEVVGIIVGLHFLGLWKASGSRQMVYIAAGMCVVSALGLLLPPLTVRGVRLGDLVTGFGNALVLWLGACWG